MDAPKQPQKSNSVREAEHWIEALPLANVSKTSELVYDYLGGIAKNALSIKDNIAILIALEPTLEFIRRSLKKYYLGPTNTSTAQKPKIIKISLALESRAASAYAFCLRENKLKKELKPNSRQIVSAIYQALTHLCNILVICFQLYRLPPKELWLKIHRLYHFADENELTDIPICIGDDKKSTVLNAYKRCLLLATTDPYRFRHQEIGLIDQKLNDWYDLVDIIERDFDKALFVWQLDQDKMPQYRLVDQKQTEKTTCRGLVTQKLPQVINKFLETYTEKKDGISVSALQHLRHVWGVFTPREHPRMPESGKLNVCIGLSATHHSLSGEKPFAKLQQAKSTELETSPEDVELSPALKRWEKDQSSATPDPWEIMYTNINTDALAGIKPLVDMGTDEDVQKPKYKPQQWDIIDASPTGLCLASKASDNVSLLAGEIIGLQEPSQKYAYQWRIGMIRWVRCENTMVKLGIQILAPSAVGIAIQIRRDTNTDYLRGLLLPDLVNIGQPSTLILPPLEAKEGDTAHIISQNLESEVKLNRCLISNNSFQQFAYETISTIKDQVSAIRGPKDDIDSDLDSAWDEIE
ncbi:MAG: hypothetical protein CMF50_10675 [Legionellales bacterium]|nr:hypothetical protein [Legionellales bacterium]